MWDGRGVRGGSALSSLHSSVLVEGLCKETGLVVACSVWRSIGKMHLDMRTRCSCLPMFLVKSFHTLCFDKTLSLIRARKSSWMRNLDITEL